MLEGEQLSTEFARWHSVNDRYLSAALAWLRHRLTRQSQAGDSLPSGNGEPPAIESATSGPQPALLTLTRHFGLSRFERETLLLCAAMELDTRIARLCAQAQGDPNAPYPTFALALKLFDNPAWDVLSPKRPLRYWRLIEINQPGALPLVNSPLRIDERIVNYLKGVNYLDDRLTPFLTAGQTVQNAVELPPSQQRLVKKILHDIRQSPYNKGGPPLVQLLGVDVMSKQLVAQHAAAALDLTLYRLPVGLLPAHTADLETLSRLWRREAILLPLALYLDASEVEDSNLIESLSSPLRRFLAHAGGIVFLDSRDPLPDPGRATVSLDIAKPTEAEQLAAWEAALGAASGPFITQLAAQFNLSTPAIHDIVASALDEQPDSVFDRLWSACLVYTRPRLDTLAQRLIPVATWKELVLPEDRLKLLHQIAAQVRHRHVVYREWGFRERMNRGLGIIALFAGESGTGKTTAAEVIANELNLNLYRIDLSAVVSKYIGETEKNLRRLFDAAEDGGAILFFDEADALFGKRSQVRDSHDRYANIEINYLLQRLEAYQGLAILATNMKSALDEGFTRRLRFVINFPLPEAAERKRVWERVFPAGTPLAKLDYDRLAQFNLAGGSIHNAALNAAFLAAEAGTPVTMPVVLDAIRSEFLKSERLLNEADYQWEGE